MKEVLIKIKNGIGDFTNVTASKPRLRHVANNVSSQQTDNHLA
jgi:hypothetical protein